MKVTEVKEQKCLGCGKILLTKDAEQIRKYCDKICKDKARGFKFRFKKGKYKEVKSA